MEFLKEIWRKRALRKFSLKEENRFIPIDDIKTAIVIIDVEDAVYDRCYNEVCSYFRQHNAKAMVCYVDFRKLEKDDMLLSSVHKTLLRTDLNWYGRPDIDKIRPLVDRFNRTDLLICLAPMDSFPIQFIASASSARFKIGVVRGISEDGNEMKSPYDITISTTDAYDGVKNFKTITNLLDRITV